MELQELHKMKIAIDSAIENHMDNRMKGSPTNSPIGCQHWFNTILGQISHIGDYMKMKEFSEEERQKLRQTNEF